MSNKFIITILIFLLVVSFASAENDITILNPEHDLTYGPWSDTYVFYPRTESNAHQIMVELDINQETVHHYQIFNNNIPIQYAGGIMGVDANPDDAIFDFPADDTRPATLVGPVTTLNEVKVIAFDEENNVIDEDAVTFYLSINIEDYFEILERQEEGEIGFTIKPEDIAKINIEQEVVDESTLLFDIKKEYTFLTVEDKFTGSEKEHTGIKITITPKTPGVDLTLYNLIPKYIVEHVNELVLEDDFTIVDPDPIMMWQFANVQKPKTLEYHVEKKLKIEEIEEIKAITISENAGEQKAISYFLLPVLLIPIVMFGFIFFSRYQHHHKEEE
jgi:hypothetical protein